MADGGRRIQCEIVGGEMRRLIDLVLFVLLMAGALWLMYWQNNRLDAAAVSTLAGALFGGAAVVLGNWINRSNEWQRAT